MDKRPEKPTGMGCLIQHRVVWGNGGMAPCIFNFGISWANCTAFLKITRNFVVRSWTRHLYHKAITATAAWAIRSATDSREPPAALTTREGHTAIARAAWSWSHRRGKRDWKYIYSPLKSVFACCFHWFCK